MCLHLFPVLFLGFFPSVLLYPNLLVFFNSYNILLLYLTSGWEGRWRGAGKRRGNYNQDIPYEKESASNKWKKKNVRGRRYGEAWAVLPSEQRSHCTHELTLTVTRGPSIGSAQKWPCQQPGMDGADIRIFVCLPVCVFKTNLCSAGCPGLRSADQASQLLLPLECWD